jgi:hypothetical protein
VIYSCDNTGNVAWTLNYLAIDPGTTTTAGAGTDDASVNGTAVANRIYVSSDPNVIDKASIVVANERPIRLTITRDVADANVGNCIFYGADLFVTRAYMD